MNGVSVDVEDEQPGVSKIMEITWGLFSPEFLKLAPQDIVLASDCFYDVKGSEHVHPYAWVNKVLES